MPFRLKVVIECVAKSKFEISTFSLYEFRVLLFFMIYQLNFRMESVL